MRELWRELRPAALMLMCLGVLTGILYPAAVTGLAQGLFPARASGSLITRQGRAVGSELIGQRFDRPEWFWGRPSATEPSAYNAAASQGSNLGPTNPALLEATRARLAALAAADPSAPRPVPADLVTASASGLDPHISPEAALYQAPRVARARGLGLATVRQAVLAHVEPRQWGVLGEPRVNVLRLNLALAEMGGPLAGDNGNRP